MVVTRRPNRVLMLAFAVLSLALTACGGSDDSASPADTTTTEVTTTTEAEVTTTEAPATTAPTTEAPATTEAADTTPPDAPTGVACLGVGGGSGEIQLSFDAPADPSDVDTIRVYVDEGSGFQRIVKTPIDGSPATMGTVWDLDTSGAATWTIGVYPVGGEVDVAITFADAAGNESGWNPISVNALPTSC